MDCNAFYDKIKQMLSQIYKEAELSLHPEDGQFRQRIDRELEEHREDLEQDTQDWNAADWKELFFCYVKHGDVQPEPFVTEKIVKQCGVEFIREQIVENTSSLEENVYFTDDKDALYRSDVLLAAVRMLNSTKQGGADDEVLKAFSVCKEMNEHILYDLAEYICRERPDAVPEIVLKEELGEEKLLTILSVAIAEKIVNAEIYLAMKSRFKKMRDQNGAKPVFAALFGDHGDPKAIPMLRKYMKDLIAFYNQEDQSQLIFQQIITVSAVIEGLGGSTEDLMP